MATSNQKDSDETVATKSDYHTES